MKTRVLLTLSALCLSGVNAFSAVAVPIIFGVHMALQRSAKVLVWRWADPHETVAYATTDASSRSNHGSKP